MNNTTISSLQELNEYSELNESKNSLQRTSEEFERIAADPKYINNPLGQYLDLIAYDMRCLQGVVSELKYILGDF